MATIEITKAEAKEEKVSNFNYVDVDAAPIHNDEPVVDANYIVDENTVNQGDMFADTPFN